MSHIYIHVPFCHYRCTYCDFYFSVNQSNINRVLGAMLSEVHERCHYLKSKNIETIYFGGGTPSVLNLNWIEKFLSQIARLYTIQTNAEITMECNPDDVSKGYIEGLKHLGVNRISLGIQSMDDNILRWMGRSHTAQQSVKSVEIIHQSGISNFSVDFIYGVPLYDDEMFRKSFQALLSLQAPHISAYQLTVEPKTKLNYLVRKKNIIPCSDDRIKEEYEYIHDTLSENGYCHYEVSNYAKDGFASVHNSAYWLQKEYLGIGPSAHSYNGVERQWNIANNSLYIKSRQQGLPYFEKEILTKNQLYNEYVYTRLRTKFGCNVHEIKSKFGESYVQSFFQNMEKYSAYFEPKKELGVFKLTPLEGYLMADKIAMEFFIVE